MLLAVFDFAYFVFRNGQMVSFFVSFVFRNHQLVWIVENFHDLVEPHLQACDFEFENVRCVLYFLFDESFCVLLGSFEIFVYF